MAMNYEGILDNLPFSQGDRILDNTNDRICYGPLVLTVAPKEGKANTLMADQFFSPGLLLAERIERGVIPVNGRSMIELGAGCALPSLMAATLADPPVLVVITDYPDETIMENLSVNVERNRGSVSRDCAVHCAGYDWGQDVSPLRAFCPDACGYDIVILSDLLHFDRSHSALLTSLISLLRKSPTARTYVAAGKYTPPDVCAHFLAEAEYKGILWAEGDEESDWLGTYEVTGSGLSKENLGVRKTMCRWWVGKWAADRL